MRIDRRLGALMSEESKSKKEDNVQRSEASDHSDMEVKTQ